MTRSAVVTGAGRRMARPIAVELARAGFTLALNYHFSDRAAYITGQVISVSVGRP